MTCSLESCYFFNVIEMRERCWWFRGSLLQQSAVRLTPLHEQVHQQLELDPPDRLPQPVFVLFSAWNPSNTAHANAAVVPMCIALVWSLLCGKYFSVFEVSLECPCNDCFLHCRFGMGFKKLCPVFWDVAFVNAWWVDSVQCLPLLCHCYQSIEPGPRAVSFPLLPSVFMNSSSVSSTSRPVCASVVYCWNRSQSVFCPQDYFGCSVVWSAQVTFGPSVQ